MTILFTMMLANSIMFMTLTHPLSMGITIIAQTMIISMITGMMMGSFWFSYIIMITMLSGMLVLFIYMASVASNEKFYPSMKTLVLMTSMVMMSVMYQWIMETNENESISMINCPENISLNNMFNMNHKYITIMMVNYLFFTMIVVSFIVNISEGPLRMKK